MIFLELNMAKLVILYENYKSATVKSVQLSW